MSTRQTHSRDGLSAELNRQPESPSNGRGSLETAERTNTRVDAASAEFDFQPEEESPTASQRDQENSLEGAEKSQETNGKRYQGALDMAAHWAWISIFSIFGTLTRLGLQSLNQYPGSLIPPLVWAQFVGCAVMGFLTQDTRLFPKKSPKNDALYLGLTVGYCGSVTSFSAWILQVFEGLANTQGAAHGRGYNVISILTQVMITLAASIVAFRLGNHMAILSDSVVRVPAVPRLTRTGSTLLLVTVAIACQAGTIITAALRRDWRGIVSFAMVFSPAGALTRWYLGRNLNRLVPAFPMGTFAANMVGSLLESIFHLLQYRVSDGNGCSLLQGLQDGYCGALTTVSTFVVELCSLKKTHAYIYGLTSIVVGTILYVLVDGVDFWIHGSASGYYAICSF